MKRTGQLWDKICTFDNALDAYFKARRGKRYRHEVLQFEKDREYNLQKIVNQLSTLKYVPGRYNSFKIYEPKERLIMALPFRDRVVQHMICNYIEPIYEKRFYEHSYACRNEKGVHAASETLQRWVYNMDDFIILSEDITELRGLLKKIEEFLRTELKLTLNPKTAIVAAKNGIDFVGYKHYSQTKKVRKTAMRRMRRLLHKYEKGSISKEEFIVSFESRTAYMEHADTYSLVRRYVEEVERLLAA